MFSLSDLTSHVMPFSYSRCIHSIFALFEFGVSQMSDTPPKDEGFALRSLVWATVWGIGGSLPFGEREKFAKFVGTLVADVVPLPPGGASSLLDFGASLKDAGWVAWKRFVPSVDIDAAKANDPELIIPTTDTVR